MAKKKLCFKNKLFMLHLLFSCNLITWGNRSNILTVTEIQYKRGCYNPQNEMFSHFGTKRYNFKNETQLFKVILHTSKNQKKSTGFAGTKYI